VGLWSKLFGEFVDIIEWTDESSDTLVYRFERHGNEIKYGAKLTVRESQMAVLVSEGQVADVFEPGMYELETPNVPILSTLQAWPHGFESPFKAECYFFSMRRFTDLKWGTKNPVIVRDPEFGPVRLRAFGTYTIRVEDPVRFLREIAGTDSRFRTDEITAQLRNLIVSRFSQVVGESEVPVLDLAASYEDLSDFVTKKIAPEFTEYGLALLRLLVENVSLPPAVEDVLDKRTSMGIVGNLRDYAAFQAAEAMAAAAANPGGGAAEGIGLGVGMAMAQKMADTLGDGRDPGAGGPPPLPERAFFAGLEGRQAGPFTLEQIEEQVRSGSITRRTLVWSQELGEWTPAAQVQALASVFSLTPPPLPPADPGS
jgi:membrane protease subunit (stomatin/prohibitin family)